MDLKYLKENLDIKFQFTADFIRELLNYIDLPKNSKILDIGTGMGIMSIHLASKGYNVITGEPEDHKWGHWQKNVAKVNLLDNVKFTPFNAKRTPFKDSEFNALFLYNSFHHMDEKKEVIEECIRISENSGYIVIIEFNDKGIEYVRENLRPDHIDAINPLKYINNSPLTYEIRRGEYIDGYIFQNNK